MTKYKCDICGEKYDKTKITMECSDCYLKGCKIELDKQRIKFAEAVKKLKEEFMRDNATTNVRYSCYRIIDEIFGSFDNSPQSNSNGITEDTQDFNSLDGKLKLIRKKKNEAGR